MSPRHRSRPRPASGQGVIEFALVLPVVLGLVFASLDLGRYSYIRGTLDGDAQRAARLLALPSGQTSDCNGLTAMMSAGNAITVTTDPHSYYLATQPAASVPPVGQGYAYISPAVAPSVPSPINCTGASRGTNMTVKTQITYSFVPWTPLISRLIGTKTITVYAAEPSEY